MWGVGVRRGVMEGRAGWCGGMAVVEVWRGEGWVGGWWACGGILSEGDCLGAREVVLLAEGDLARFADSMNQCFMAASWLRIGW